MAETTKGTTKKGKTSVDASHLAHGRYQQQEDPTTKAQPTPAPQAKTELEEDESWSEEEDDDNLMADEDDEEERELAPQQNQAANQQQDDQAATVATKEEPAAKPEQTAAQQQPPTVAAQQTAPLPAVNPDNFFAMLQQMEAQAQAAEEAFKKKLEQIDQEIAEKNKEKEAVQQQMERVRQWRGGGVSAPPVKEDGRRRRGRRRSSDESQTTQTNGGGETGGGTARRGRRPKNQKTLKEYIVDVLAKKGRVNLDTIANEILEAGYNTNSKKFANTVRVQLYRLDDDKEVILHDDRTFSLRK